VRASLSCSVLLAGLALATACGAATSQSLSLLNPMSHGGAVSAIQVSNDGRVVHSVAADGHFRAWSNADGLPIADFDLGQGKPLLALALDPSNSSRAAVSVGASTEQTSSQVLIVDIGSGSILRRWDGHVSTLVFSGDGRFLAGASFSQVFVWTAHTGQLLVGLASVDGAAPQFGSGHVLAYRTQASLVFLDLDNGHVQHRLSTGYARGFALADDGRVVHEIAESKYRKWDVASGKITAELPAPFFDGRIVYDPREKAVLATAAMLNGNVRAPVVRIREDRLEMRGYSSTGLPYSALAVHQGMVFLGDTSGRIQRWRFREDRAVPEIGLGFGEADITATALSLDRRFVAMGDSQGVVDVWDAATGVRRSFDPYDAQVKLPPPRYGTADTYGMSQSHTVGGPKIGPSVVSARFIDSSPQLIVAYRDGKVRSLDVVTLANHEVDLPFDGISDHIRVLRNGELAAWSGRGLHLWGRSGGARRVDSMVEGMTSIGPWDFSEGILAVASQGTLKISKVSGATNTHPLRGVSCVVVMKEMVVALAGNMLYGYRVGSDRGQVLAQTPDRFTPVLCNGYDDRLVLASADGWLVAYLLAKDGTVLDTKQTHTHEAVKWLSWDARGDILMLGRASGAMAVMSVNLAEQGRLRRWDIDEWVVSGPDGRFDAPPTSWASLRFVGRDAPSSPLVASQAFSRYYQPGLLQAVLGPGVLTSSASLAGSSVSRPPSTLILSPRPTVEYAATFGMGGTWEFFGGGRKASIPSQEVGSLRSSASARAKTSAGAVRLIAQVEDGGGGVAKCNISRNRQVIDVVQQPITKGERGSFEREVEVIPGENELAVMCFDRAGVASSIARVNVAAEGPLQPGTAYVIAVAIDNYADASLKLKYAVADGKLFLDVMRQALSTTGHYKKIVQVPLFDAHATVRELEALFRVLNGTAAAQDRTMYPDVVRLTPSDALFFYFAGHGGLGSKHYEMLLRDFSAGSRDAVLTDSALGGFFQTIGARDLAVVVDACESGELVGGDGQRVGPFNSSSFPQMAYDKGVFVLVATQSKQSAREVNELGHGLLTHVLLKEGLDGAKADNAPTDGVITVRELFQFAAANVPRWQERRGLKLTSAAPGGGGSLSLASGQGHAGQTPKTFIPPFGYNQAFRAWSKP
jgi:WD40 repeat protein